MDKMSTNKSVIKDNEENKRYDVRSLIVSTGGEPVKRFEEVYQIEFTSQNTFMLVSEGKLYSWGGHTKWLGREKDAADEKGGVGEVVVGNNLLIVAIAAGKSHVLALTNEGSVYSWGKNDMGQLGLGSNVGKNGVDRPNKITTLEGIIQVFAGESMSMAISRSNKMFAWGYNKNNKLLLNNKERATLNVDFPFEINLDGIDKPIVSEYDGGTSQIQANLKSRVGKAFYYYKNPKKTNLTKSDRIIDDLLAQMDKLK